MTKRPEVEVAGVSWASRYARNDPWRGVAITRSRRKDEDLIRFDTISRHWTRRTEQRRLFMRPALSSIAVSLMVSSMVASGCAIESMTEEPSLDERETLTSAEQELLSEGLLETVDEPEVLEGDEGAGDPRPEVVRGSAPPGTWICMEPGGVGVCSGHTLTTAKMNAYCFGHYLPIGDEDVWIYADVDDRINDQGGVYYRIWVWKGHTGPVPGLPRC